MPVALHVHSDAPPLSWGEFTASHPPGSIALDGYVKGPPRFQAEGPYANFNHHEGVDRLATLSTAQQVTRAIRMGLPRMFSRHGTFSAEAYVNDCDEDVCAAWFMLSRPEQALSVHSPALNRFLEVAGTLDATAGAYPYSPDMRLLGELDWVFEPYHLLRAGGEMAHKENSRYRAVITDVGTRIQQHLVGRGGSVPPDTRYERIGGGKGWAMIRPVGRHAAVGAFRDGLDAFVTMQPCGETRWRYGLRRRSVFIPFTLQMLYDKLSDEEGCGEDRWGGADTAGGSPRIHGSSLPPAAVETIINSCLAEG